MSTIIVGTGIIGVATAYYLSQSKSADRIHLVEVSPDSFASASGYAGGFLAADWFAPLLSILGRLSFDLHKQLAEENNGRTEWGYSMSTGTSLAEDLVGSDGEGGADWLMEGASRAMAAENTSPEGGNAPGWLRSKGTLDVLSSGKTTAQVDPRRLCNYLHSTCLSRGVHLHQPAKPLSISRTANGALSSIKILKTSTQEETTLPCAKLVLSCGAWTPQVFNTLFPASKVTIPVESLSGHSLVLHSKHWPPPPLDHTVPAGTKPGVRDCHAVFTTDAAAGYSPELMSRMPDGEIYLAGLNSSTYPLPAVANERVIDPESIRILKETARRLLGDDIEVIRESVCWRPTVRRGVPIISEMEEKMGRDGKGVFVAAGHGPWGISLSLGTGWCVAGMIEGRDVGEYVGRLGL